MPRNHIYAAYIPMKRAIFAIAVKALAAMGGAQVAQATFAFGSAGSHETSVLKALDGMNRIIGSF